AYLQPATPAVEAHSRAAAIHLHVMHVDIAYAIAVHIRHHSVVVEVRPVPIAALIHDTEVSKSIIDASVEPNMAGPVTVMEAIPAAHKTPVTRCPQGAHIRRLDPAARHPVVPIWPPGPVARRPDVVGIGRGRLVIIRQRRRGFRRLLVG